MAIRYCSFATRGYRWRQWMRMKSLKLAEPSVELSFWTLGRLLSAGIRREVPWFDPHLQGVGYWCWKPFIMLRELDSMQEGDYLLYTDAGRPPGTLFRHSVQPLVQWLEEKGQDILPGVNISYYTGDLARWCKQSVFDALNLDIRDFEHSPLIQPTPCFLKKSEESIRILREWMELCRQFSLVSSPTPEEKSRCRDNFAAHTHDQTLWSLVAAMNRLDSLYSGKGVIHLDGRHPFLRHPGFDDKDPDFFLGELGAERVERPLLTFLSCAHQGFAFCEKAVNKLSKIAGLGPRKGFYG